MTLPTPYYSDSAVTIYHGDCRELLPLMPPVDLVFGDPPYGVGFQYESHDDSDGQRHIDLVLKALSLARSHAPITLWTCGIRNLWDYPRPDWVLCWAKMGGPGRSDLGGFNIWEPILMYGRRKLSNDLVTAVPGAAVGAHEFSMATGHPCPKPKKLLTWLIANATDDSATILDPFMGSGTTLRAAKDLGRRAIGIEIEERYCEIAAKRMSQTVFAL